MVGSKRATAPGVVHLAREALLHQRLEHAVDGRARQAGQPRRAARRTPGRPSGGPCARPAPRTRHGAGWSAPGRAGGSRPRTRRAARAARSHGALPRGASPTGSGGCSAFFWYFVSNGRMCQAQPVAVPARAYVPTWGERVGPVLMSRRGASSVHLERTRHEHTANRAANPPRALPARAGAAPAAPAAAVPGVAGAAQPSGGPYGPVPQTYAVPAGAPHVYYVAPDGRAEAAGTTLAEPTTLESAIERVVTGDVVVLRGGTYRTGGLRAQPGHHAAAVRRRAARAQGHARRERVEDVARQRLAHVVEDALPGRARSAGGSATARACARRCTASTTTWCSSTASC